MSPVTTDECVFALADDGNLLVDVINAVSVTMAAEVNHWIETDEDDTQSALYWRQAFNCNTSQLSVRRVHHLG